MKIKSFWTSNKASIIVSGVLIILSAFYFFIKKPLLISTNNTFNSESLYNLLTVNTIFAGFTYTMLGNMVEFSAREDIKELDTAGYIAPYFSRMYFSLFFFIFSIFIELVVIFFGIDWQLNLLLYVQQVGTLLGLVFFVLSTMKMRRMINKVRNKM